MSRLVLPDYLPHTAIFPTGRDRSKEQDTLPPIHLTNWCDTYIKLHVTAGIERLGTYFLGILLPATTLHISQYCTQYNPSPSLFLSREVELKPAISLPYKNTYPNHVTRQDFKILKTCFPFVPLYLGCEIL